MPFVKRLFLPGIILQSVLIGGGFATGREIVEYGARFGRFGWVSGVGIFFGFSVMAFLSFEACRQWQVFDYKSLLTKLIGRWWVGYEVTYLLLTIITIAVMAAAAGAILKDTLGLNQWIGVTLIVVIVGWLNYGGEQLIARLETLGTIALFAAYLWFSVNVYLTRGDWITRTMSTADPSNSSVSFLLVWTGILYVGYNLGVYPATYFTVRELKSSAESFVAAIVSGVLMTIPWFLTYFALMAYYPDPDILQAPVPWLRMLHGFGVTYIFVFGIVVGWTLIETATGVIHAFITRVDVDYQLKNGRPLGRAARALISLAALLMALILSSVGIIDLISKGYKIMAYGMIAFYALPLLAHAPRLIKRRKDKD